jgi:hypothetical protein
VCADPKLEFAGGAQVRTNYRRRVPALLCVPALIGAMGLSACGGFDSAASGENLIKDWVPNHLAKSTGAPIKLDSVSCPSGVKQTVGTTYDCKVTLENTALHQKRNGTITIHIASGNKVVINGIQDLRVT